MGDSMSTIINATTTNGVVIQPDNSGSLQLATNNGTTAVTISTAQNVGIGTSSPTSSGAGTINLEIKGTTGRSNLQLNTGAADGDGVVTGTVSYLGGASTVGAEARVALIFAATEGATSGNRGGRLVFNTKVNNGSIAERMRIDSSGNVLVGTTSTTPDLSNVAGIVFSSTGTVVGSRSDGPAAAFNRKTNDGTLVSFRQDGTEEGTISVSGTTVSYNGGHLSRWSQLYNETTKVNVYRGTVLESVDAMCVWEKDGQPLPNEQATKTIVSTTVASKTVAGVFDRYDEDDETNPYDFYVAQSGDFVIRIAQGVTVQNGDLLESAGDGTAKPQADDICRSSTIAKVTSNYVSVTYEDGSYCVPCILMIG
jgi:hypothetical protein